MIFEWHSVFESRPKAGRAIVATVLDMSGARAGRMTSDGHLADAESGDEYSLDPEDYGMWAYLPGDTEFWFEQPESNAPSDIEVRE